MTITFYHNPNCSKSRAVSALLQAHNIDAHTVEYLKVPFSADILHKIVAALDGPPAGLVRTSDSGFRNLGIDADALDADTVVKTLLRYPELFQRPVVVANEQARIGRPPERILEVLL